MKTLTHSQAVKQQNITTKQQIQELVGITHEQYCQMQFNMGLSYLNLETEGNYPQTQKIAETKVFWSWWANHWAKRDMRFLDITKNLDVDGSFYSDFNNPNCSTFHHLNLHMAKSYENMITNIIRKELRNV